MKTRKPLFNPRLAGAYGSTYITAFFLLMLPAISHGFIIDGPAYGNVEFVSSITTDLGKDLILSNQYDDQDFGPEGCAAGTCCGGSILLLIIIPIVWFVINILLLVWVTKDAKTRGMDNPAIWLFLVLFFGFIPFIIYFFARPAGNIITCPHCGNNKMESLKTCPHCGH
jgi:hypothetical protein